MSIRLPPLNPLRAFEAAARHGSVSRAARELNVTHGAVSHQIRALETALQIPLLERGARRFRLTPHAAALLPTVSTAFEEIAAATARMTRPFTAGSLAISCVPALLSLWLIPRLSRFTEQYPGVRCGSSLERSGSRLPTEIDICIATARELWRCWGDSGELELFRCPVYITERVSLPRGKDLVDHVLLHADDGREWQTWLTAANALELGRGDHHFMTDARLAIEAAIHANGVVLGDTRTVSNLMASGSLVAPFDQTVPAIDNYYVVCRNEVKAAPIANVFIDWLFAARDEEDAKAEVQAARRRALRGRRRR